MIPRKREDFRKLTGQAKEGGNMARIVGIGHQDFETVRKNNYFYIDKTEFIREWWESGDEVTLITRPRRFGKTLAMSMVEKFFSTACAGKRSLFEGLSIWEDGSFRALQGSFPVISLSFADVKETTFAQARKKICRIIKSLYSSRGFLLEGDLLNEMEKKDFQSISVDMEDNEAAYALKALSDYLCRYYKKKVIILLDEYDTPMQEAYMNGYWDEAVSFTRSLFNSTFKTNPFLERAIMTGITRVSKESVFSDLNNLEVITSTSAKYASCFGFREEEVFAALQEYGLSDRKTEIKRWYDGFKFGDVDGIYNPWSIINFLDKKKVTAYWANTSSNGLAGKLLREGGSEIKQSFEDLLSGRSITVAMDEQVVYDQLDEDVNAVWSLLVAGGYLKVCSVRQRMDEFAEGETEYELMLTNLEVKLMFRGMVRRWFGRTAGYSGFIKALLEGDLGAMNDCLNRVAVEMFSFFDTGEGPSRQEPERFYHGFVLGLLVELTGRYSITSNRESGYGRYDVLMEPLNREDDAIILEFKVYDGKKETGLRETAQEALRQIRRQRYDETLKVKGIGENRIRHYGIGFKGKKAEIIGGAASEDLSPD